MRGLWRRLFGGWWRGGGAGGGCAAALKRRVSHCYDDERVWSIKGVYIELRLGVERGCLTMIMIAIAIAIAIAADFIDVACCSQRKKERSYYDKGVTTSDSDASREPRITFFLRVGYIVA